ncbi:hypothetical protein ACRRTK_013642 [Alexandromys fortis]
MEHSRAKQSTEISTPTNSGFFFKVLRELQVQFRHGQVQEPHHTQPIPNTEMASRNPGHKDMNLLKEATSFLRNLHFAKKHRKKGLRKMQADQ